ncbi:hypothetical protein [Candidatus Poriferisodalis sp.]|uniref:hypothetical protein n=1 Tax=Candidatus Poriferisodalis sp. TaxID=3101277 RepID=UPI003B51F65C
MDAVTVLALAVGAACLLGGIVGVWVAMRTATRVAVKIVSAVSSDSDEVRELESRVSVLEGWRTELERIAECRPKT